MGSGMMMPSALAGSGKPSATIIIKLMRNKVFFMASSWVKDRRKIGGLYLHNALIEKNVPVV